SAAAYDAHPEPEFAGRQERLIFHQRIVGVYGLDQRAVYVSWVRSGSWSRAHAANSREIAVNGKSSCMSASPIFWFVLEVAPRDPVRRGTERNRIQPQNSQSIC